MNESGVVGVVGSIKTTYTSHTNTHISSLTPIT